MRAMWRSCAPTVQVPRQVETRTAPRLPNPTKQTVSIYTEQGHEIRSAPKVPPNSTACLIRRACQFPRAWLCTARRQVPRRGATGGALRRPALWRCRTTSCHPASRVRDRFSRVPLRGLRPGVQAALHLRPGVYRSIRRRPRTTFPPPHHGSAHGGLGVGEQSRRTRLMALPLRMADRRPPPTLGLRYRCQEELDVRRGVVRRGAAHC